MGYRSDVAIGMAFPSREAVTAFLSYVRLGDKMSPEDLAHYSIHEVNDKMTLLHTRFEWVKWYESYPDVKCHLDMLEMARESGAGTALVRIGENDDDIEQDIDNGNGDYDMWELYGVKRELHAPGAGIPVTDYLNNTTKE